MTTFSEQSVYFQKENTTNVSVQGIVFQEGRSVGINIVSATYNGVRDCEIYDIAAYGILLINWS